MPTVMLNARLVASITPTSGKRREYFDEDVPGLALRVTESGAKSWTVLYRHHGRLRRMTLGTLTAFTLAKARKEARDVLYAGGGSRTVPGARGAVQRNVYGALMKRDPGRHFEWPGR